MPKMTFESEIEMGDALLPVVVSIYYTPAERETDTNLYVEVSSVRDLQGNRIAIGEVQAQVFEVQAFALYKKNN